MRLFGIFVAPIRDGYKLNALLKDVAQSIDLLDG